MVQWSDILSKYPGASLQEKFNALRAGKTYKEVASEIGKTEGSVKQYAYWRSISPQSKYKRGHIVRNKARVDYSKMMTTLIEQLSREVMMSPQAFKIWIHTRVGEKFFHRRCGELRFPIFVCAKSYRQEQNKR